MKAARFHEYGEPEVLRVEEAPIPTPGPGQLLIAVRACGVNPIDWKIRSGSRSGGRPLTAPMTTGTDGAGIVEQVGEHVTGISAGDEVFGYGSALAAEYGLLDGWARKPQAMSWEQAACLGIPAETAGRAMALVRLAPGDLIVIDNAAGGVGTVFGQLALGRGLRVIGTCSQNNAEYVRELGLIPIDYGPGLPGRIAALDMGPVVAGFDLAGKGSVIELIDLTGEPSQVVSIVDFTVDKYGARPSPATDPRCPAALTEAAELFAAGKLRLDIATVYQLDDIAAAQRRSHDGHVRGKLVIRL